MTARKIVAVLAIVASAVMGTAAEAGNTYYTYDGQARLTQKCQALSGNGELTKYSFDRSSNRTNYSNIRTDIALYANQGIYSPSGNVMLWMQGDSNLVIYTMTSSGWSPLWSTNTVGAGANVAYFQSDGNLVLYTPQGAPVWSSGTYNNPCATIAVSNAGKATITNTSGTVVWSAP